MYAEIINATGLTQRSMELFVLLGICVSVIGFLLVTYWRYIIFGGFAIFCVVVLANQKPEDAQTVATQKQEKPVELDGAGKSFLEDCMAYTDYTEDQCKGLWVSRDNVVGKQQRARILDAKYKVL
jgi:hypothetical protein